MDLSKKLLDKLSKSFLLFIYLIAAIYISPRNSSYEISKYFTNAFIVLIFGSVLPFSQSETVRAEKPNSLPSCVCDSFLLFRKYFIVSPILLSICNILAENPLK